MENPEARMPGGKCDFNQQTGEYAHLSFTKHAHRLKINLLIYVWCLHSL